MQTEIHGKIATPRDHTGAVHPLMGMHLLAFRTTFEAPAPGWRWWSASPPTERPLASAMVRHDGAFTLSLDAEHSQVPVAFALRQKRQACRCFGWLGNALPAQGEALKIELEPESLGGLLGCLSNSASASRPIASPARRWIIAASAASRRERQKALEAVVGAMPHGVGLPPVNATR